MNKFTFYHIHNKYIGFLYSADKRVQHNKDQHRPYVGIVLQIKQFNYFVSLESPKPNYNKLRSSGPTLKLDEGKLGIMGFNNMIPVPDAALLSFNFENIKDEKYRNLLYNQLQYCNKNKDLIYRRAASIYKKAISGKILHYKKVCCDFKKLERMSLKYNPSYKRKPSK